MTTQDLWAGRTPLGALLDALQLVPKDGDRFAATSPDWWGERLFGGMVVAQALAAATRCVDGALRPHSMHGYFFRPVVAGPDADLVVERVRDGRSFATREVTTRQNGKVAARMTCSFCVDESGEEYQPPMPAGVSAPEDLQIALPPGPFESCDAGPLAAADGTYLASGRFWNRTAGTLPNDPSLQACVLALMSDMTRTSFRPRSLHTWGSHTDASIDHAVWFHRPARPDDWLLFDLNAIVNTANRAVVRGSMYTRDGELVLTMMQELLIRPIPGGGMPLPWLAEKF